MVALDAVLQYLATGMVHVQQATGDELRLVALAENKRVLGGENEGQ